MRIADIQGTMTLANGQTVDFQVAPGIDTRWGNTVEMLGHAVNACEVIGEALKQNDLWTPDMEDPDSHHEDCDFRNSYYDPDSEIFDCNANCDEED